MLCDLPYNANDQQVAVVGALARFCQTPANDDCAFILNGYAGTGKTSLTGALVRCLERHRRQVLLLAPTGRAAKVSCTNAGGHQAFTIHRKIYRHSPDGAPSGYGPLAPAENKLHNAVIIVDEASMIGNSDDTGMNLLEDLIMYVFSGENCRLILIGDTAQLPPVGAERSPAMNAEVLRSMGLKVTMAILTETARQAADSGILFNATRLRKVMALIASGRAGEILPVPKLKADGLEDVRIVEGPDLPDVISSAYDCADNGASDSILITRSNRRAAEYNAAIRAQVLYREEVIERGDMLIVSHNHYFSKRIEGIDFIANGDIVTVEHVYGTENRFGHKYADVRISLPSPADNGKTVEIDIKIILDTLGSYEAGMNQTERASLYAWLMADNGPYANINPESRRWAVRSDPYWTALQVKYAYAVTCHKAQGGQWRNVFVDLAYIPEDALGLSLYRWLYTAVTRAKTTLYLINPPEALIAAE